MESYYNFTCYLMGETSLLVQCAELLKTKKHHILGIISSEPEIVDFAEQNKIPLISLESDYISFLREVPFDYFFSIVNHQVIKEDVLNLPQKLAINYHDSLLPSYAGIHATSWAIMNREKTHGISWHIMTSQVDTGDILKQPWIEIGDRETAFRLNIKCYQAALESFDELIDELAAGRAVGRPQDIQVRSYFGKYKRPSSGCIISWKKSAAEIDALTRALNFGVYSNSLGLPKIKVGDDFIIVKEVTILDRQSKMEPGLIVYCEENSLTVATSEGDIRIEKILSIDGKPIDISNLSGIYQLRSGIRIDDIPPEIGRRITELYDQTCQLEPFWVERLSQSEYSSFPQVSQREKLSHDSKYFAITVQCDKTNTALKNVIRQSGYEVLLLSVLAAYFYRLSGKEHIWIGFQNHELKTFVRNLEGLFADILPVHAIVNTSKTFTGLMEEINEDLALIQKNSTYPRDIAARYPILYRNSVLTDPGRIPVAVVQMESQVSWVPEGDHAIIFSISQADNTLTAFFSTDLFDSVQAKSYVQQLQTVLQAVLENPDLLISELPILSQAMQHKIVHEWNHTQVDYARNKCIHQLFEEQAEKCPHNIAAISDENRITYGELNRRANQTAEYLIRRGVGPEVLVGICHDRSPEMLIGLLGILKAGGVYVPLEPSHPSGRLETIARKAGMRYILTQEKYHDLVAFLGIDCMLMDREQEKIRKQTDKNPIVETLHSSNTAYVIFTSGSTGEPKGVVVKHRPVINLIEWGQKTFSFTENDCVLFITALGFDLSVFDIFGMLAYGGSIRMIGDEQRKDLDYVARVLCEENITFWDSAPAALQLLVPFLEIYKQKLSNLRLRLVFLSGDWIPLTLPDQIRSIFQNASIISLGGATEATVWSNYYPIGKVDSQWRSIPYGKPIQNAKYYILDSNMKPCPVGVEGDLYIGGECLSEGYLNESELTEHSFIPDPFSAQKDARMYRTGDMARYFEDGNIEFLGRSDFQVKVRGYRIELGEIEQRLRALDGVAEAIVVVKEIQAGDQKLVAYVIPQLGKNLSGKSMRKELEKCLPDYMIPNYIGFVENFPVTDNGKIDRKMLPWPLSFTMPSARQADTASPGDNINKLERKGIDVEMGGKHDMSKIGNPDPKHLQQVVTAFLCEMLKLEQLDPDADLFDLGASSLNMIRLAQRIKEVHNTIVPVEALLEKPTVSGITEYLCRSKNESMSELSGARHIVENRCLPKCVDSHPPVQNGWRSADLKAEVVRLPYTPSPDIHPVTGARQAVFGSGPIDLYTFGRFLSLLRKETINGEAKYLYPSAGGLYAVQTYIYMKSEAVEGLSTGIYYYSPIDHALYLVDNTTIIDHEIHHPHCRSLYNSAGFCLFFVAKMDAIRPIYSSMSTTLVSLDTGYICQLLLNFKDEYGIELCPVEGVDFGAVRPAFKLDDDHVFMHCLLGGKPAVLSQNQALSRENQVGFTDHFRTQPESIHEQDPAELAKLGQFNALTEDEHILFHRKQLNIRRFSAAARSVPLSIEKLDKQRYLYRSSQRSYLSKTIPLTMFSRMLSLFRPMVSGRGTACLYPSAGDMYAVQTYLYIKPGAVEELEEGIYYYDSEIHALLKLRSEPANDIKYSHYPGNRSFYDESGFCVFHIARLDVFRQLYGDLGIHYAMVESGCIGQLLMDHQHEFNIGVCPVGGMNFERIAPDFKLDKGQVIVQSFIGGYVDHRALVKECASAQRAEKALESHHFDSHRKQDIAIIGISGRFPGAQNLEEFWQNIKNGHRYISQNGNDGSYWSDNWGGFLASKEHFDSLLFKISPAEAKRMDPQERQFLETAWECLENAGYNGAGLHTLTRKIGVFVGAMWGDYLCVGSDRWRDGQNADAMVFDAYIANRVSHFFNFKGPSMVVDTSCSSALTAFHLACESIRRGECEAALVGGVNIIAHPYHQVLLQDLDLLSADNRCCAFSAEGTGWVVGEGVGAVLIRPLDAAERNQDHIHAVIKGTAVSHSGRTTRFGVVSTMAQAHSIMDALNTADVPPESITYVEAAATGAALADAAEMNALVQVFAKHCDRKIPCLVGSVKPNIGHLESASTMSQVAKVIMQMKHGRIVPTLDCSPINPVIRLEGNGISLARELTEWCGAPTKEAGTQLYPLRALINSFGSGGTNGHMILEAYVMKSNDLQRNEGAVLVPLSAASEDQLRTYARRLYEFCLNGDGSAYDLNDIAFTLQSGRVEMEYRMAVIALNQKDLCQKLNAFLNNGMFEGVFYGRKNDNTQSRALGTEADLLSTAQGWVEGASVKWPVVYGNGCRRVPLPTYPFAKESHWLPLEKVQVRVPFPKTQKVMQPFSEERTMCMIKDHSGFDDELVQRTRHYLVKIFSELSEISRNQLELNAPLEHYGINSLLIKSLNLRLARDVGNVSEILFFETRTLSEAASYLVKHHAHQLKIFFSGIEPIKDLHLVPSATPAVATHHDAANDLIERAKYGCISRVDSDQEGTEIAIIGLSGRYPMAKNLDEFWANLASGKDCITEIPSDRWDYREFYMPDKNKSGISYSKWGGFIEDFAQFDPLFFNMSPNEAALTDPQERLFLMVAWEALEDAGYTRTALKQDYRGNVGVFVGTMYAEYQYYAVEQSLKGENIAFNTTHGSIANRLSYFLDFDGPSMAVDTFCSSSLTALHLAAESIRRGECKMAIAGGVNLNLHPNKYLWISRLKMASAQGRCKPFGTGGDGFVPSEGVGAILLKPLKAAKADNDHIYAVIKSTAINHDGKTNGYTVPNPQRQAELIQNALSRAGIDPRTISYIEAHGTGTSLGDPIEIGGLSQAFRKHTQDRQFCAVGSVKSNIGHLEAAAGIAALTKVLLQIEQKQLVPSIHAQQLNENIKFEDSPFYVQRELTPWKRPCTQVNGDCVLYPRRAGISSFGAGGANAHVILEEYVDDTPVSEISPPIPQIILLSAKNEARLKVVATQLHDFICKNIIREESDNASNTVQKLVSCQEIPCQSWSARTIDGGRIRLIDMAYTLQVGREPMEERLALLASDFKDLCTKLKTFCEGKMDIEDTYRWSPKLHGSDYRLLLEGEEGRAFVYQLIQNCKLLKLIQLWGAGVQIDWKELHAGRNPKRISLPTYPFETSRYWIPEVGKVIANDKNRAVVFSEQEDPCEHSENILSSNKSTEAYSEIQYLIKEWKEKSSGEAVSREISNGGDILVFENGNDLSDELHKKSQLATARIIRVKPGQAFSCESDHLFCINPAKQEDYDRLFSELEKSDFSFGSIIHCWSSDRFDGSNESVKLQLDQALYSIFFISRAFLSIASANRIRLLYLFEADVDGGQPLYQAVSGFARSLQMETNKLKIQTVEFAIPMDASKAPIDLISQVVIENLCSAEEDYIEMKCLNGKRMISGFREWMPKSLGTGETTSIESLPFRKNGCYLITGGAGGLGLIFSRYLVQEHQAKVVLVGRSELTPAISDQLGRIETPHGRVVYYRADISKQDQVEALFRDIKAQFGKINGVFHCAGVIRDALVRQKNLESLNEVLAPKVQGTIYLDQCLQEEELDFFVLFSSISSQIGNIGQSDYAYANSFMDSFAIWRESKRSQGRCHGRTISINWPLWEEGGMSVDDHTRLRFERTWGMLPLNTKDGLKAFETIIGDELSHIMVMAGDKVKIRQALSLSKEQRTDHVVPSKMPVLAAGGMETALVSFEPDKLNHFLREQVSLLTGIALDEVDEEVEFWDIGIDSILTMQIIRAIEDKYGLTLYLNELQEHNTLEKLNAHLQQEIPLSQTSKTAAFDNNKGENGPPCHILSTPGADSVNHFLLEQISILTGIGSDEVDEEAEFLDIGIDSILTMQIIRAIEDKYGLSLYPNELQEHNTLKKLNAHLQQEISQSRASITAASDNNKGENGSLCFILSTPRAGSTLLRVMLMGNSQIFAPPELHLLQFDSLNERKQKLQQANRTFLREGLIETIKVLEGVDVKDAIQKMDNMESEDLPIAETYRYLMCKMGDRILVDKSPTYGEHLDTLRKADTISGKVKYIYLVRHPLSMMASFVENRFDKMLDIKEDPWRYSERLWVKINANIMEFLAGIPDNRKIFIRYEDLVGAPEETLKELCRWLDVDFENEMLEPYRSERMIHGLHQKSITIGDPGFLKHKAIVPERAEAWKAHAYRLQELEPATTVLARELGYSLAVDTSEEDVGSASAPGLPGKTDRSHSTPIAIEHQKELPLSPAQQSILNRLGHHPHWGIVEQFHVKLDDPLDLVRFNDSLRKVVEKHSMLSHSFTEINNALIQRRQESVGLTAEYRDLSSYKAEEIETWLKEMETELISRLNIETAPLMAISVAALGENQYAVIAVFHIMIADGRTCEIILEDIFRHYQDPNILVSKIDTRYADYIASIESMKKNGLEEKHLKFWLEEIKGPATRIPADHKVEYAKVESEEIYYETFSFDELLINSQASKAKLFLYFSVGLYSYLSDLTGQVAPVITHRFHRRNLAGFGSYFDVAGRFAGDVPVRLTISAKDSVKTLIRNFQKLYNDIPLQGLTYEILANNGKIPATTQVAPILLNFQYGYPQIPSLIKCKWHQFEKVSDTRAYEIDLIVRVSKDSVRVIAKYSNKLYKRQTVEKHVRYWIETVKDIIIKDRNDTDSEQCKMVQDL